MATLEDQPMALGNFPYADTCSVFCLTLLGIL
jgi:hypothetical protein